jgi:hypothetical protein
MNNRETRAPVLCSAATHIMLKSIQYLRGQRVLDQRRNGIGERVHARCHEYNVEKGEVAAVVVTIKQWL